MTGLVSCLIVLLISQYIFTEVIVTRRNTSSIDRPCRGLDLKCVRGVFSSNGWCSTGRRYNPKKPYYAGTNKVELPSINVTLINTNTIVKGLNSGVITDFFININSDTVVISVRFVNITVEGVSRFNYHIYKREDITIISTHTYEEHPRILTTTVSSGWNKFKPGNMVTSSHVYELPEFYFYGIGDLTDTEAINMFLGMAANKAQVTSELFLINGPRFAEFYINNVICGSS